MELPSHPPELYFCFLYDKYEQDIFPEEPEALVVELLDGVLGGAVKRNPAIMHKRINFNQFHNLSEPEFYYVLDCHQKKYASVAGISLRHEEKLVIGNRLVLSGSHTTGFCKYDQCTIQHGKWRVEMLRSQGNWLITGIYIEGIEF
jgi:hypothetical protein